MFYNILFDVISTPNFALSASVSMTSPFVNDSLLSVSVSNTGTVSASNFVVALFNCTNSTGIQLSYRYCEQQLIYSSRYLREHTRVANYSVCAIGAREYLSASFIGKLHLSWNLQYDRRCESFPHCNWAELPRQHSSGIEHWKRKSTTATNSPSKAPTSSPTGNLMTFSKYFIYFLTKV